jgi:N-acetylneuraminate lyase
MKSGKRTMNRKKIEGLIAAPITPFRADGAPDFEAIPPYAQFLADEGVAGVFVNGTTGEGASLSVDEREALALAWREALPRGLTLIVHAGCQALPDARRIAAHAAAIGADAVAACPPSFFRTQDLASLTGWCAGVAAAAPALPFYYYHIPSMTGAAVRVSQLFDEAAPRIPNLAGVKFTHEAMDDYLLCLRRTDGASDALWGRDEMLLGALATGARGMVGSTYNVAAPLYRRIIAAFEAGDLRTARALQSEACRMIDSIIATGAFFSALKQLLRKRGLPIHPAVRAPLPEITPEACARMAMPGFDGN